MSKLFFTLLFILSTKASSFTIVEETNYKALQGMWLYKASEYCERLIKINGTQVELEFYCEGEINLFLVEYSIGRLTLTGDTITITINENSCFTKIEPIVHDFVVLGDNSRLIFIIENKRHYELVKYTRVNKNSLIYKANRIVGCFNGDRFIPTGSYTNGKLRRN